MSNEFTVNHMAKGREAFPHTDASAAAAAHMEEVLAMNNAILAAREALPPLQRITSSDVDGPSYVPTHSGPATEVAVNR